jgi:hypothetical protein
MRTPASTIDWFSRRAALAASCAVLAVGLAGCWPFETHMYQNFKIMAEDENGKVLGSAVWQYGEKVSTLFSQWARIDGEAFPIEHPTAGRLYVIRSSNSGRGGGGISP